jgi:hypothetical protein
LKSEDGIIHVPLKRREKIVHDLEPCPKFFELEEKVIEFGVCEVGHYLKINTVIKNLSDKRLNISIRSRRRNWKLKCDSVFVIPLNLRLPPFSKTEFIIEFWPRIANFAFEEVFVLEVNDQSETITVSGKSFRKALASDSQRLEFPACDVGRISRGRLRIKNRSDERFHVTALVKGPFACPIQSFVVEANCYVMFPVHFAPRVEGRAVGSVKFTSKEGEGFTVDLRGYGNAYSIEY